MSTAFRDDEAAAQTRLEHLREENQRLAQELARLEPAPVQVAKRAPSPEAPQGSAALFYLPFVVVVVTPICLIAGIVVGFLHGR